MNPVLPDGIFSNQNPNLGKVWRDLQFKIMVDFMAIRYILWPFGMFRGHLVYFFSFWYVVLRKIWQP
jgi:hypothetical protein